MGRPRKYATNAERQRAYRARHRAQRWDELIQMLRAGGNKGFVLALRLERNDPRAWILVATAQRQARRERKLAEMDRVSRERKTEHPEVAKRVPPWT